MLISSALSKRKKLPVLCSVLDSEAIPGIVDAFYISIRAL